MAHITRSAKGEIVDFDLMKIKQQLASAPAATNVAARQMLIENKLKRRSRQQVQALINQSKPEESAVVEEVVLPIEETAAATINPLTKEKK